MRDILGWATLALILALPLVMLANAIWGRNKFHRSSGGAIGMFDEIWAPSAAEARAIWEAEQELPIEAPSPDGDNPMNDALESGRVTITPRNRTVRGTSEFRE